VTRQGRGGGLEVVRIATFFTTGGSFIVSAGDTPDIWQMVQRPSTMGGDGLITRVVRNAG
jgi:hypothetical protein